MKKFFTFITAVLLATSMFADVSTLTFEAVCGGSGTADDGAVWTVTSDAAESNYDATKGIHYGTSKKAVSYLHLTTDDISGTITKIVVNASGASSTTAKLNVTVGGSAFDSEKSITASAANYTFNGSAEGEIVVALTQSSAAKALYAKSITVTYSKGSATQVAQPQLSVEAGIFKEAFDLTISCSTEGANIYYTLDGNDPTSASTLYEGAINIAATTTVKAIAIKEGLENSEIVSATYTKVEPVTSNDIDFETADLELYVNWDFTNIAIASTAITAHGGKYYGNTDGKASASITSKAAIALPGELTFYTSKESGNTTASSWKVQVSADKEEWTDVASFDATTGSKGEWTERIAELNDYTNVYVRISYGSSTAIRAIDDITLTEAVPTSVAKPTFSVETGTYTEAKNVELACETEGATIYYTINGDDPTEESTEYTAAIALSNAGIYTIKAIAIKGEDKSKVVSATYIINLPFASLSELVSAFGATEVDDVTVTLTNIEITDFSNNRKGVFVNVKAANDANIELYNSSTAAPEAWKSEGKLSGTISGNWVHYTQYSNDQWEIVVSSWEDLTYNETATAIDNTSVDSKAVKTLVNGQLVIEKNGRTYNAQGQLVK